MSDGYEADNAPNNEAFSSQRIGAGAAFARDISWTPAERWTNMVLSPMQDEPRVPTWRHHPILAILESDPACQVAFRVSFLLCVAFCCVFRDLN
ncbi:unnamed protein product [Protopolystoma xenopodis]|uniref:Uncharacterized protein n=1 Tax=Protopolystoma xenopodis TaxID=117903 RepID=A0A3S4ZYR9_9PLAT|nr:unnamed protein product [Protopolystoma xenopodis]